MEKDIKVYRGDGKEVIINDSGINIKGSNPSILVFDEELKHEGVTRLNEFHSNEALQAIQETFELNKEGLE